MMKSLSEAFTRGLGRQSLTLQENSPKILFVGGVVGMVGSTVLACRSTLRLQEVLDEINGDLATAKGIRELHPDKYSEEERQKDTVIIYARSGAKMAKLYAPSVALGVVSIAALTKSHAILSERNTALTAAYVALDKGFREYRARVVEKYGEQQDREFRYETEEVHILGKNGEKIKRKELRAAPGMPSGYARFFDETSPMWSREHEYNVYFLNCQQNYINDRLRSKGHVFLNEVYDMLGIPRSRAGQIVGWRHNSDGDGYIDFGVFLPDATDKVRDFVNGREGAILLDFNVDGPILNNIDSIDAKEHLSWPQEA